MDIHATVYAALYASPLATDATLTPNGGSAVAVRVMDITKGAEVSKAGQLNTIVPVADVRMSELADLGVAKAALRGGTLTLEGTTWRVTDYELPRGDLGHARLHLTKST